MKHGLKVLNDENKTMTSLEIIEVTGKQHKDTIKLIKTLVSKGLIRTGQFYPSSYTNHQNKTVKVRVKDKHSKMLSRLAFGVNWRIAWIV